VNCRKGTVDDDEIFDNGGVVIAPSQLAYSALLAARTIVLHWETFRVVIMLPIYV